MKRNFGCSSRNFNSRWLSGNQEMQWAMKSNFCLQFDWNLRSLCWPLSMHFQVKGCYVERFFAMTSAHLRICLIFKSFGLPDDVMQFRLLLNLLDPAWKPCSVWVGWNNFPFQSTPASICSLSGVWYPSVPIPPPTFPFSDVLPLLSITCYRNSAKLQSPLENTIMVTLPSTLFMFPSCAEQKSSYGKVMVGK